MAEPDKPVRRRGSAPDPWPSKAATDLPAAAVCAALMARVDFLVPSRADGRRPAHREGYCVIRAIRWLAANRPELFPATLYRSEAPDFVLQPASGARPLALEHTDAGEQAHQRWLSETEGEQAPLFLPSPDGEGWLGSAPERAFDAAIRAALRRKSADKYWRSSPKAAVRYVLAYDQTNSGLFVSDADAVSMVKRAVADIPGVGMMLVRGSSRVLVAGVHQ